MKNVYLLKKTNFNFKYLKKSLFLHSSTVLLLFELSTEPRTTAAKQGMLRQGHEVLQLICPQTEREAEVEVVILRKFLSSLNVNFPKQIKKAFLVWVLFWIQTESGNTKTATNSVQARVQPHLLYYLLSVHHKCQTDLKVGCLKQSVPNLMVPSCFLVFSFHNTVVKSQVQTHKTKRMRL